MINLGGTWTEINHDCAKPVNIDVKVLLYSRKRLLYGLTKATAETGKKMVNMGLG
jgi:formylmethanofuran dehydrogenase subunit B